MTDPTPTLASLDGSTFLSLVSLTRGKDPRMDEASFKVVGPELIGESTIDAYLMDTLFSQTRALVAGETSFASFGCGELTFRREGASEIRVQLAGGPYVGAADRAWLCGFSAANHAVAAFCEGLEDVWHEHAL